jgi:hypothetical protein
VTIDNVSWGGYEFLLLEMGRAIDRAWIVGSYAALDEFEQEVRK